jgi:uncharacterized protein YqeY
MTLIEKISADFLSAYKNKEMDKKDFLGLLKSEVTRDEKLPSDSIVISKIKSMIKSAESTNSLTDMELSILQQYLPAQMSESDLTEVINNFMLSNGIKSIKEMGKVMGWLKSEYGGKYDGAIASNIIKNILS